MIQAFLLIFSLSIDSCIVGFSMGINRIKLSIFPILILSGIGMMSLIVSIFLGRSVEMIIHAKMIDYFSTILFILFGLSKIIESLLPKEDKEFKIRLSQVEFIFHIYAHPEKADKDHSKDLSCIEAIPLGISLSLDNFIVGIGIGLLHISWKFLVITGFMVGVLLMVFGYYLGSWLGYKVKWNLSWVGGILLLLVAFWK